MRSWAALIAVVVLGGGALALGGGGASAGCPDGYRVLGFDELAELAGAERAPGQGTGEKVTCLREGVQLPEPPRELSESREALGERIGAEDRHALARAVAQRQALQTSSAPVIGTAGSWKALGTPPLIANDPEFRETYGSGWAKIGGRISDFAYDVSSRRVYAAVGPAGVWVTDEVGAPWRAASDTLPTQTVGAVGWTPAGGGTLIALTGDSTFSGWTYSGLGAYFTTDGGASWTKSKGVPDGALGFRVAVDPSDPNKVYLATGLGLFRSIDAGRNFENVRLPTGECSGKLDEPGCGLANVVTDVVVQGADSFGHTGGAVLAAVGWRAGNQEGKDGKPQAPYNGLYKSADGAAGSFELLPATGFTARERIGRVEMGAANGEGQNTGFVYAIVQDSVLYSTGKFGGIDEMPDVDPVGLGVDPTNTYTLIDGIYSSPDFGETWTLMAKGEELGAATSGSALAPFLALGLGPGIFGWYAMWIQPDPFEQAGGVPTRLVFGLEEVWESKDVGVPQVGKKDFKVVGPYSSGAGACILVAAGPTCSDVREQTNITTTHPDQHAAIFIPGAEGGHSIVVGNDGGAYTQPALAPVAPLNSTGWGEGINDGFRTLYPYGAAIAKDGTVYAGLQDNGALKIAPDGKQVMARGADGVFALVEPDDSNVAYEETQNGLLSKTTDGGRTWANIAPSSLESPPFVTPIAMDPTNAKHTGIAAANVFTSTEGMDAQGEVFDLGSRLKPGVEDDEVAPDDDQNIATAMDLRGEGEYVGYCGSCQAVQLGRTFQSGIATSVGGKWHIAAAAGLPERLITSLAVDGADPRTVYATLSRSTNLTFLKPGAGGDDLTTTGGSVWKSTDGGESFRDITGDLPSTLGATWVLARERQIVVATPVGVFASAGKDGGHWGVLGGSQLPSSPVFSLGHHPGNANAIIAAVFGRGVWQYEFKDPPPGAGGGGPGGTPCLGDKSGPRVVVTQKSRTVRKGKLALRGTAKDVGCNGKVVKVEASISKKAGRKCKFMDAKGRFGKSASCKKIRWLRAKGTTKWSFNGKKKLKKASYRVFVRAVDGDGNKTRTGKGRPLYVRR